MAVFGYFLPPLRPRIFKILLYQAEPLNPSLNCGTSPKMELIHQFCYDFFIFSFLAHFGSFLAKIGYFKWAGREAGAPSSPLRCFLSSDILTTIQKLWVSQNNASLDIWGTPRGDGRKQKRGKKNENGENPPMW